MLLVMFCDCFMCYDRVHRRRVSVQCQGWQAVKIALWVFSLPRLHAFTVIIRSIVDFSHTKLEQIETGSDTCISKTVVDQGWWFVLWIILAMWVLCSMLTVFKLSIICMYGLHIYELVLREQPPPSGLWWWIKKRWDYFHWVLWVSFSDLTLLVRWSIGMAFSI